MEFEYKNYIFILKFSFVKAYLLEFDLLKLLRTTSLNQVKFF